MSAAALQPSSIVDLQVMPRRLRIAPRPTTLLALAALILFASPPADAQQADPEPANRSATVQDVERLIESQRQLIEAQGRRIDELQGQIDEMRTLVAAARETPPAGAPTETVPKIQWPELPPDIVSAGDFPGSFKIPGTDAAVRIGGMVRVNWVTTFDPLLTSDSFITSDIPVDVAGAPVGGRVDVIAFPSRFNLDFRTPTGVGYLRAYVEGDFSGSGNTLSLRHAFGQWRRFLFGQTWSTFSDPEAVPDGIDFEGLNAAVHFRQPQVRWTWAASERVRVAMALENADTELTDASGANQRPDFVSRIRWEPERGGHIQVAGLFRQLRGFPSNLPADLVGAQGWGVNASGSLPSFFWSKRDLVLFQVIRGAGIGHYIKDLNADGGQDGVFDSTTNTIRVLPALAGYASYEHWWKDQLHSALTAGAVNVTTLDLQPGSALQRTDRYSANLIWSPIPRLELVTEMLYGIRVNRDLHRESALQLQIGSTFRF